MQKLFSTPQDWYTWNGDCVCGPYLSESILELAASKCLTKDSKLIGVEVGGKPPVTEGEFKTYAQFLVEMYCSGRVDAKNVSTSATQCYFFPRNLAQQECIYHHHYSQVHSCLTLPCSVRLLAFIYCAQNMVNMCTSILYC